jgi:hypothetical protein
VIEQRCASAPAVSEQKHRLGGGDGADDRVSLAGTIDEPALVGLRPDERTATHGCNISENIVLAACINKTTGLAEGRVATHLP